MKAQSWREIKAEADKADPWFASQEAQEIFEAETERIEAEQQGYALSALRRDSGMTQKEVAEVMGISQARVSQIEHGQINSLDLLRSYISAVGGELHLTVSQGPLNVTLDLPRTAAAESTPAENGDHQAA
ncbi:helix-turn-helix domain-containing protein [Nocardiopsis sp. LOL_012]|uniref:helix-turn-helix domain-containing protein n=1 Tax=Nocardiopsis sp. LOL_012 TaxID=3345409 RepID=UPI003A876ADC